MHKLSDIQLLKLGTTLHHIKNSNSFYWSRYESDRVTSYEDLTKMPFMTKEILRTGYPFAFACVDPKKCMRMHMSSGTTGHPIINPMTESDVSQWGDMMARCYTTAGVTSDDIVQITPSFGLFNGGFGFHYGAEKLKSFIIPMGAGRSMLQLQFIKDLETTCLCAIASYPMRLIEVAKQEDFDFRKTKLRVGIFGAETWTDGMRKRIEREMGIESFDIIGMTETGGVGLGIDCTEHDGIHVWDDHYIVEIINPETGEPLPDGQEGEMVVTTLTREGLPLIRYRTRDITKIISREPCKCGLHTVKVARLKGRTDDMLKVKGVNFYPAQIESILMEFTDIGEEYRIILDKKNEKGDVTLAVETSGMIEEDKDRLLTKLYDFLGFHVDVQFLKIGTLERSAGKAVRVVDNR
ncbi:MAG: phenylacetate--CoA ligase family protein [Deferribacterales bacterium]